MRKIFFLIALIILLPSLHAQTRNRIPAEKPKLIIGIVVDQMRYDYIQKYWNDFEDNGFKRLINEGTICRDTRVNYLFTQPGVGHATVATGTYPSYHGIVGLKWYNDLTNEIVHCTKDTDYSTIGGSFESGQHSPHRLMTTSFADELRLASNKRSKTIGISLEAEEAVLSAGHTANGAYWFDQVTGNWVSSSFYMDSLPVWVDDFNLKRFPDTYLERTWNPLLPLEAYDESNKANDKFENGIANNTNFPYDLEKLSKNNGRQTRYELIHKTPFGNTYTKDFAIASIVNEELGTDEFTDYLTLNFSVTEHIGKSFGPTSIELQDIYIRLDKDLAHFLDFVNDNIGKENVLIYLTSANGVSYSPDFLKDARIPGGHFNHYSALTLLRSYLNAVYGQGEWVKFYFQNQVYLNRKLIEDSDLSLEQFQTRVAQFLIQFEGVANAVSSTTLHTRNYTKGILEKIQNGFNQKNSGDVIINLKPGWIEKSDHVTGNNSAYAYDSHVPLIWYGWKIKRQRINRQLEITDIAPTLSSFLDIAYPGATIGRPILELME
ncbi:MAG: alkaline phosphatase family protein [Bacteroidota bacterium]